jgi:pimeloyl-ACP methyl ester carboxylesterase
MIRALGAPDAYLVGHDWGGLLGWAVATLHPSVVRSLAVVGMPHPVRMRQALLRDPAQLKASSYTAFFQLPRAPEARLVRDDAAYVGRLLRRWGGPGFPDEETARRCRAAMQIPGTAHCALEWYRWAARSQTRPSGQRFLRLMAGGVQAPVLQVHGGLDRCTLLSTVQGSDAYAHGGYALHVVDTAGHFVHEEQPALVTELLLEHARA